MATKMVAAWSAVTRLVFLRTYRSSQISWSCLRRRTTQQSQWFCNMSVQLLLSEAESRSISSLPPLLSISHWLTETNNRIWGSEDTKVLKQYKECFQACHKGMVGSEVFYSSRQRSYPWTSYRIHNQPTPQVLDADYDLLASAESVISIQASEFKATESLVRGFLSVLSLSYNEHFDVASSMLLQLLLQEVSQSVQESWSPHAQMLLNLKLSQARAVSHLTNIEAKTLDNPALARRDSFLACSKVAGDQQLKNFLRTTSTTHSLLFEGQLTPVAKELSEHKRRLSVPSNTRSSTSTITASQEVHSAWGRAQPVKPHGSRQPFSSSAFSQVTPGKRWGCQAQEGPAKKARSAPKNLWLDRVLASLCPALQLLFQLGAGCPLPGLLDVLQLLQPGLWLSFVSQPPLTTKILSMLEKKAIKRVSSKSSPGSYSLLFVIPKKIGKLRLVIDLQSLNHHLAKKKFHMETPANLRLSI